MDKTMALGVQCKFDIIITDENIEISISVFVIHVVYNRITVIWPRKAVTKLVPP